MSYYEFRLRGVEILPSLVERVKRNVCMIICGINHKIAEIPVQSLIANVSLLYAAGLISKGTGFLTSDGYVVTAYHVVKKAIDIKCLPCTYNNLLNLKIG
jgi:S1-C subfamily serine protease